MNGLRTGRRTKSGMFWVGVKHARNEPVTKWGANHPQVTGAISSACRVLRERGFVYAAVLHRDGRVMWDSNDHVALEY